MVRVKMLMEIGPLAMRGALVMTMAMISPSRREVSPAEQLCRSPRLVLPRGGGVSSRKLAYDFSSDERLHIAEDGHRRANRGPMRQGAPHGVGRAPHPRGQVEAPLTWILLPVFFIISQNNFHGLPSLLELCKIGL